MKLRPIFKLLIASTSFSLFAAGGQPNPPNWPDTVRVYNTTQSLAAIQADADMTAGIALAAGTGYALLFQQGTYSGPNFIINMREFGSIMGLGFNRSTTTINDVRAVQSSNEVCVGALNDHWKSAENFTTIPINVVPNGGTLTGMAWAGSQGCPLRNITLEGNLFLSELINKNGTFFYGASTGAFVANSTLLPILSTPLQAHLVYGGSQQQTFFRNVSFGSGTQDNSAWDGGKLNQVFVGCRLQSTNIDPKCGNCQSPNPQPTDPVGCACVNSLCCDSAANGCVCDPSKSVCTPDTLISNANPCNSTAFTIVDTTPKIAEKPYIASNGTTFSLVIPQEQFDTVGATSVFDTSAQVVPFDNVYVARPGDNQDSINGQLSAGNHVVLTPGVYLISGPIRITQPNTVLMGIGFPMIVGPQSAGPKILVDDVDGVRVAGIILINVRDTKNAGDPSSRTLFSTEDTGVYLQWGTQAGGANVKSGYLYDCFGRMDPAFAGIGTIVQEETRTMVEINSANIVCDNVWLWRNPALFAALNFNASMYSETFNLTGAQIRGDNVIAYGLICDYAFGNQLEWYGNNGQSYGFQGTFPFDQTATTAYFPGTGTYKYAGYYVNGDVAKGSIVTNHTAYGTTLYSNFLSETVVSADSRLAPTNGIDTPTGGDILFVNASTKYLGGSGGISNVINGQGYNTDGGLIFPGVCQLAPGPSIVCTSNGYPVNSSRQQGPRGSCP